MGYMMKTNKKKWRSIVSVAAILICLSTIKSASINDDRIREREYV
jgi:hypothetical protein